MKIKKKSAKIYTTKIFRKKGFTPKFGWKRFVAPPKVESSSEFLCTNCGYFGLRFKEKKEVLKKTKHIRKEKVDITCPICKTTNNVKTVYNYDNIHNWVITSF